MELGSKFVYLGNEEVDYEERKVCDVTDVILSDSDCSDDDGETCFLDILDTAGQEEFSSLRDQYVRTGRGFVIIYSITDAKSFQEAESIYNWIRRVRDEEFYSVLVANKQDLVGTDEVVVSQQDGQDLAKKLGVPFYETSAKTGSGVQSVMQGLVKLIPRRSTDYKIVMLGAGAVGKSSITLRFVSNSFFDDYDPTIEDSFRKMISVPGLKAISKEEKKAFKKKAKKLSKTKPPARQQHRIQQQQFAGTPHDDLQQHRPRSGIKKLFGKLFRRSHRHDTRANLSKDDEASAVDTFSEHVYCNEMGRENLSNNDLYGASSVDTFTEHVYCKEMGSGSDPNDNPEVRTNKIKDRKADGNVVLIPLRNLAKEPNLVTGEPIRCNKCRAILTSTGILEGKGDKKTWPCEFCGKQIKNLNISEDEIPKHNEFDYMLSPPTKPKEEKAASAEAPVEKKTTPGTLVYCMDISGSMNALCSVPESHAMWREERTRGEESIGNVTRLKCIQKAIERLAEELKREQPKKKVLLVVFSSNVVVKAGGRRDRLPSFTSEGSFNDLLEIGLQLFNDYPLGNIEQTHEAIDAEVKALYPTGSTALGPALTICTGFVSKTPSSEIILCTDGEPNGGIGGSNDWGFYEMIGNYARSKNITINILSMEGASTELQHVSKAAEQSGGTTRKLNPVEIMRQLRLIAQNEVVATAVTVRFYLHPDFVFDEPDFPNNLSQLEKEVGSVKKDTDLTFRFKVKDCSKTEHIKSVPFQVQIEYTRPDGMQCLRVLTMKSEATNSRKEMEENINVSVLGVSSMKTTAKMAQSGQVIEAQHMVKRYKGLVDRGAKSSKQKEERVAFRNEVAQWDDHLTYNNERMRSNNLMDEDIYLANDVYGARHDRLLAASYKNQIVSERKLADTYSREAYYGYTDNM